MALQEENKLMPVAACEEWWEQLAQTSPVLPSAQKLCVPSQSRFTHTQKSILELTKRMALFLMVPNEMLVKLKINKIKNRSVFEDQE